MDRAVTTAEGCLLDRVRLDLVRLGGRDGGLRGQSSAGRAPQDKSVQGLFGLVLLAPLIAFALTRPRRHVPTSLRGGDPTSILKYVFLALGLVGIPIKVLVTLRDGTFDIGTTVTYLVVWLGFIVVLWHIREHGASARSSFWPL